MSLSLFVFLQLTFHAFGNYILGSKSETEFHTYDYICQNDWFILHFFIFALWKVDLIASASYKSGLLYNSIVLDFVAPDCRTWIHGHLTPNIRIKSWFEEILEEQYFVSQQCVKTIRGVWAGWPCITHVVKRTQWAWGVVAFGHNGWFSGCADGSYCTEIGTWALRSISGVSLYKCLFYLVK